MPSARETTLKILSEREGNKIDLTELGKELAKRRVLGFGVEAWDVVWALESRGKVTYNRETDMVYLVGQRKGKTKMATMELIKYNYSYQTYDACKGDQTKNASRRALLFKDKDDNPIAITLPVVADGLKIVGVKKEGGQMKIIVLDKQYKIHSIKPMPFQNYRVLKVFNLSTEMLETISHAIICMPKMEDIKNNLRELINKESKDFRFGL